MIRNIYEEEKWTITNRVQFKYNLIDIRRNIKDFLEMLIRNGVDKKIVLNVMDLENNVIHSDDNMKRKGGLLKDILRVLVNKSKAISNRYDEFDKSRENYRDILTVAEEFDRESKVMSNFLFRWTNFKHRVRTYQIKRKKEATVHENIENYLNILSKRVKISKKDRDFMDKIGIKYNYRNMKTGNRKGIKCTFVIENIWFNVQSFNNQNDSYAIPFGQVDDNGKAQNVKIIIYFDLGKIINAFVSYTNNMGPDSYFLNDDRSIQESLQRLRIEGGQTFNIEGRHKAVSKYGVWVKHPFLEYDGGLPCFGDIERDIYNTIYSFKFLNLAMMLRHWASNFTVGATSPHNPIYNTYPGIKKEYGRLGIAVGKDVNMCRNVYVRNTNDCKEYECILRKTKEELSKNEDTKNMLQCTSYIRMERLETKAE